MSMIRIITLMVLFILWTTLPSQSTNATMPNVTHQFSCTNVTEIPQIECEALVALYNGTNGPNWRNTTGWLVTNMPCNWAGVTCDKGHITQLELIGSINGFFGLQGHIPAEIGNLNSLTILALWGNQLTGLPAEIGNLNNLAMLSLAFNQFSNLPVEIGNLNNLTSLYLSSNKLSILPSSIGNLNRLTLLDVESNLLSSLPAEVGSLSSLRELDLDSNRLGSLPANFTELIGIQSLSIANNHLTNLSAELQAFLDTKASHSWIESQSEVEDNAAVSIPVDENNIPTGLDNGKEPFSQTIFLPLIGWE